MKNLETLKKVLPKFVRTFHAPIDPNASRDDLIASEKDFAEAMNSGTITIEEKVDGANCGIAVYDGHPIIRNRNHILNKSYAGKTPAKMQFSSIWNWYYQNAHKFERLADLVGFEPSVYGEWLYAQHSIRYTDLPDLFVPFDIYNSEEGTFLSPLIYREVLTEAGFTPVPKIAQLETWDGNDQFLLDKRQGESVFSPGTLREGLYIKICDGKHITHRFKMVRGDFIQGEHWNKKELQKNGISK